jgi:hypothetical protein
MSNARQGRSAMQSMADAQCKTSLMRDARQAIAL